MRDTDGSNDIGRTTGRSVAFCILFLGKTHSLLTRPRSPSVHITMPLLRKRAAAQQGRVARPSRSAHGQFLWGVALASPSSTKNVYTYNVDVLCKRITHFLTPRQPPPTFGKAQCCVVIVASHPRKAVPHPLTGNPPNPKRRFASFVIRLPCCHSFPQAMPVKTRRTPPRRPW